METPTVPDMGEGSVMGLVYLMGLATETEVKSFPGHATVAVSV